jgi:DNA polymerase IV
MIACLRWSELHNTETLWPVLSTFSPDVELTDGPPAASGYLDLGHLPEPVEVIQAIAQAVRAEGNLTPAMGVARSKFPACVAAAVARPSEALIIAPWREAKFLAPLPVELLPLDEESAHRLHLLGIRTLGQLATLPVSAVLNQFGTQGRFLRQLAQGRDDRRVFHRTPPSMESAVHQFDSPVIEWAALEAVASTMATELSTRLQAEGWAGRQVRLTLHLENRSIQQKQLVMRHATADPERLARIFNELLAQARLQAGVIEMEIVLADLVHAVGQQLDLFASGVEQGSRLCETLKDLVARYGADCFYQIALPNAEAHLPERRFLLKRVDLP